MGAILNLVERNLHEVQVNTDRMLFHIPSSSLFATDALTGASSTPCASRVARPRSWCNAWAGASRGPRSTRPCAS